MIVKYKGQILVKPLLKCDQINWFVLPIQTFYTLRLTMYFSIKIATFLNQRNLVLILAMCYRCMERSKSSKESKQEESA